MRNKTLLGAILGVLGCVVLREAYAKGFNKGAEECKKSLEGSMDIIKAVNDSENKEEES